MPDDLYNSLLTKLSAKVQTVWPDIVVAPDPGKMRDVQDSEELSASPFHLLDPPYAIIHIPELEKLQTAQARQDFQTDVEIYYVSDESMDLSKVRQKAQDLAFFLDDPDNDFTDADNVGQIIEVTRISWSRHLPINEEFIGRDLPHRAVLVVVRIWTGRGNLI